MSLSPAIAAAAPVPAHAIKVVVVDDSAVVRGLVSRWVDEDPALQIVGKFSNGKQAVEGVAACMPDILLLDIEMPVMDGMTALPQILKNCPNVKVIVASTLTRRNAEISLRALSLGAVDYIPKPEGNSGVTRSATFREELVNKIKAVGGQAMRRRAVEAQDATPAEAEPPAPSKFAAATKQGMRPFSPVAPRILAIGASTGGPKALSKVIGDISGIIRGVPVVITQHMPTTFTSILAEHLGRDGNCTAKEAENGEPLVPGTIYVAPGGFHMALSRNGDLNTLKVYDGPDVNFCKPAVDPLFESVARIYGPAALGIILTGMGHDGALGARAIADKGGSIIAQDEATSVVWGMPGATYAAGACAALLPIDDIGGKAAQLLKGDGI